MNENVQIHQNLIKNKLDAVLDRIAQAAKSGRRRPEDVQLVVVTKGQSIETVHAAIEAGAHLLGENYVEEALPKIEAASDCGDIEWHMIGHIQSRKAKTVVENFDFVHSLDSMKLARRLDRYCEELGRSLPVLLELNVSGEESKYGWPAWDEEKREEFAADVEKILAFPNLRVQGLMTMAPYLDDPEGARPYFRLLRQVQEDLAKRFPRADWKELSMGMSADFEVAIQEGATIVRIGTAILGDRP